MMAVKITRNTTPYDTAYLRRLFTECERREGTMPRIGDRQVRVKVRSAATWRVYGDKIALPVAGWAWYNSRSLAMRLPVLAQFCRARIAAEGKTPYVSARECAQVYIHEVGHNQGLRHKDMMDHERIDVSWWPDEALPLKPAAVKPPRDLPAERARKLEYAQERVKATETRIKRLTTCLRKWRRKVAYYQRQLA